MSTSTHSATLSHYAGAEREGHAIGHSLWHWVKKLVHRIRTEIEDTKVRWHLATLPDALLRDIGIAEDEIHRIRACERFTPRAWAERMSHTQRHYDA
jgi:uncharacterized protein YjiS (DUF1127 family)